MINKNYSPISVAATPTLVGGGGVKTGAEGSRANIDSEVAAYCQVQKKAKKNLPRQVEMRNGYSES